MADTVAVPNLDDLIQRAAGTDLAKHTAFLRRAARPAVKLVRTDAELDMGDSVLGGDPDLPADFAWPTHDGVNALRAHRRRDQAADPVNQGSLGDGAVREGSQVGEIGQVQGRRRGADRPHDAEPADTGIEHEHMRMGPGLGAGTCGHGRENGTDVKSG